MEKGIDNLEIDKMNQKEKIKIEEFFKRQKKKE